MEVLIESPLVSFLFVGLGLALMCLEVFIPSGGILGVAAFCSIAFGVFGLYHQGSWLLGSATVIGSLAFGVAMLRIVLRRVCMKGTLDPKQSTSIDRNIADLAGRTGMTESPLRPAGVASIDGRRVDVVARGQFVAAARPIEVVEITGNRVVVREIEASNHSEVSEETNP